MEDGELQEEATIANFATTATDGKNYGNDIAVGTNKAITSQLAKMSSLTRLLIL